MKSKQKSRSVGVQVLPAIIKLVVILLVLVGAVAVGLVIRELRLQSYLERRAAQAPKSAQPTRPPRTRQTSNRPSPQNVWQPSPVEEPVVEPEPVASEPNAPPPSTAADDAQSNAPQPQAVTEQSQADRAAEESAAKERRGRAALALIGHDPSADRIWIDIINDPTVSRNARSNLIEDLNEDGISNPRNPAQQDLPVIEYRIALVEDLRPRAMDKTNADAFDEAHKDLVNMANRLR